MSRDNQPSNIGARKPAPSSNGNGAGKAIPQIKARFGSDPRLPASNGHNGNGHHNGNGYSNGNGNGHTRLVEVRPVKARVGSTGTLGADGNGNGNGGHDGAGTRLMAGNGAAAATSTHLTTGRLRETDLRGMRFRLGQEPPVLTPAPSRPASVHNRPLPYFLMRHRTVRASSRVGHTRRQVASARFSKTSPFVRAVQLGMAFWMVGLLFFAGSVGAGVAGAGYYISQLPPVDPGSLAKNGININTTKIFDRNGTPLYDLVSENTGRREELALKDISPLVISATVAAEDASFYSNQGVDPLAIGRAVVINLGGDGQSGGSTITQQLVRQVVLSPEESRERSFNRKIKEAVLAVQMAQTYSKDTIMEMFLNQNYYGHRAYGIGAAALTYFGKKANDLTLPEAALLAGLPQAPTDFDPIVNPDQAKKRQSYVLDQMAKLNMITADQATQAKSEEVHLKPYKVDIQAPHFVYYVKKYLEARYGPRASELGLKVYTTLDLRVQQAAEQVARDRIEELRKQRATNAAIVIMKPHTGEILGMVGSVDYNDTSIDGQVNVALAERQPGSSFKPITYVTAFEHGWTPGTVILDTLTSFPNPGQKPYIPKNYDGKDHGWVTVRESLANSFNIPAVKALQFAGVQNTIDTAHNMGIGGLNRGVGWYGLSLTLGGGEVTLLDMTNAYSTFANGGTEMDANPIMRIEDAQGRTIYQLDPNAPGKNALDPRYTYMITSILSDNNARAMEFGLNSPLHTSFPSAAKTGTTNDNRDSWTMGYTPELTVGVWVGNSNNAEMQSVTGAIGAAVIWHNMIEKFYSTPTFVELLRHTDGTLQRSFVQPDGLAKMWACSAKGDVNDLILKDSPPRGCLTYKDKNQQLHSLPTGGTGSAGGTGNQSGGGSQGGGGSNSNANPAPRPKARPTPLPGIGPPDYGTKP